MLLLSFYKHDAQMITQETETQTITNLLNFKDTVNKLDRKDSPTTNMQIKNNF